MRQTVEVTYADGRVAVGVAGVKDFVAFERKFDQPTAALADGRLEWYYYVAYLAMKNLAQAGEHEGPLKPSFDAWMLDVEDVRMLEDDAVPLDVTPS